MRGIYRFAGRRAEIDSLFPDVHELCRAYRTAGTPGFTIRTAPEDIDRERERAGAEARREGRPPQKWTEGYLETLAVYRALTGRLLGENILLFHGSAVAADGACYLFTAKSGTGKSTHARLWRELLGERAVMVNDDKPLLEITDGSVTVWGTPWSGKHRLDRDIAVPLAGISLLERGEDNSIRPISPGEAWPVLLQQCGRPEEPEALAKTLALADRLAHSVPLYRLRCRPDIEAARMAYEAMRKGKTT